MARADGLLTHEIDPTDRKPQDQCGVFGIWAPGEDVAKLVYFGLYALQHRGQESAGIATSNGEQILVYRDMGLVSQVFDERDLETLPGHLAIGHTRYSTTGSPMWENAQPTLGPTPWGTVALAHNGNLTNFEELEAMADARRPAHDHVVRTHTKKTGRTRPYRDSTNDTSLVTELFASAEGKDLTEAALEMFPKLVGAFSFVFMDETTLYAARDPHGVRPLALGRLEHGWVVASETAALDIVGASFVREVEPGELIAIDEDGLRSYRFAEPKPARCVFEYVYLARPDSVINGKLVHASRAEMGRVLAREHPVEADMVMATPESGTPAAVGYAEESGIPFGQGLMKNAYVGRTFIQPSQTLRQQGIRLKLNPLKENIAGKRIVVVDDSIVRGNTQRALVRMLREAGAKEIHIRISSPPVKWPCFYGIDFATRAELIANGLTTDEICQSLGADSLGYISVDGMIAATTQEPKELCTACFTGTYPITVPSDAATALERSC
ncbi:amidophosphoribosyltransferase [Brevibacterium samyangense]|uniref:Amidophosphoribosyltransferase n=1 Tax=Brevibacterium samyangense TaxID=366888 RepID=A0ABP5F3E2_9MICO